MQHWLNNGRLKRIARMDAHNRHPGVAHAIKRLVSRRRRRRSRQRLRSWYDGAEAA